MKERVCYYIARSKEQDLGQTNDECGANQTGHIKTKRQQNKNASEHGEPSQIRRTVPIGQQAEEYAADNPPFQVRAKWFRCSARQRWSFGQIQIGRVCELNVRCFSGLEDTNHIARLLASS